MLCTMPLKKYISVSLVFCLLTTSLPAMGATTLIEGYRSARAVGMGNAYSAVVDNMDAIFYNPAALAKSSGVHWLIMDPGFGFSNLEAIQNMQNLDSDNFSDTINALSDEHFNFYATGKSGMQLGPFAFLVYQNVDLGLVATNPVSPTLDVGYINDVGYALGFALPFVPGIMSWGATIRYIRRQGDRFEIGVSDLASQDEEYLKSLYDKRGTGYALDTGFLIRIPGPVSPTFSIAAKNVGSTKFKTTYVGVDAPPSDPQELTAGFALNIDLPLIGLIPSIEIKHVDKKDVTFGRKLHLGFEFQLLNLSLRAGLHQGYWAAGLGIGLGPIDLDLASYGVELGEETGQIEDRRYMLQLSLGLGLDFGGGFGSSSKGVEQTKTEQRRAQRVLKKRS